MSSGAAAGSAWSLRNAAARVARAQREGDLPAQEDAEEVARSLLAAQQGLVFMGRTGMDVEALRSVAHSLADRLL